ncbi:caspase family protein [Cupriavidus sp. DF5525]|uniref:caspase family protein n=1 Tax=Cupriavidus sp. DF5525 TaxID=3160989 RepID=UPI0032DF6EA9
MPSLEPITGHSGSVEALAISPDGSLVATGGSDFMIRVWNRKTSSLIRVIPGHTKDVLTLAFSVDNKSLLSGSADRTARIWNVETGQERQSFHEHKDSVEFVRFFGNAGLVLSADKEFPSTIRIWDTNGAKEKKRIILRSRAIAYAYSGKNELIVADDKGNVQIWALSKGKLIKEIRTNLQELSAIASDGGRARRLLVSSKSGVQLWDRNSGSIVNVRLPDPDKILGSFFTKNDDEFVILRWNGAISRCNFRGICKSIDMQILKEETLSVFTVSSDGMEVAVAYEANNRVAFWSVSHQTWWATLNAPMLRVTSVSAPSECDGFFVGDWGQYVWEWNLKRGAPFEAMDLSTTTSYLYANGRFVLGRDFNRKTSLIECDSSVRPRPKPLSPSNIKRNDLLPIAVSPSGEEILTTNDKGELTAYTRDSGATNWTSKGHSESNDTEVLGADYSVDGEQSLTYGKDGTVRIWNKAGKLTRTLKAKGNGWVFAAKFSPDGKRVLAGYGNGIAIIWQIRYGPEPLVLRRHSRLVSSVAWSPDGNTVLTGSWDTTARVWDSSTGSELAHLRANAFWVTAVGFLRHGNLMLVGNANGTTRIFRSRDYVELLSVVTFSKRDWLVSTPDGRFDTNSIDALRNMQWIMPDDPMRPLKPDIFMRHYYEPGLLSRLLNNDAGGFDPVPPLVQLNRVQPAVRILGVRRGVSADSALVSVEVTGQEDRSQRNGKTRTAAYALRLFRNGQMVGEWPRRVVDTVGGSSLREWRRRSFVPKTNTGVGAVHTFTVRLAAGDRGKAVNFSAYSFNEDRVKSETAEYTKYVVPVDVSSRVPRAFVVSVGVNSYDDPNRNLSFAANDARALTAALGHIKGFDVIPISIISDTASRNSIQATKANIHAVLDAIAGKRNHELKQLARESGINFDQIEKATPDDIIIFSYSGHGYSDQRSRFYLVPSDSGLSDNVDLRKLISADDIATWTKDIDAGAIIMIIDACYSAAGIPKEFKPGPMGDRGLGQLAYDKGMLILAATQANNVALESAQLQHGLLTYALVQEGLNNRLAATDGTDRITLTNWLQYGAKRVPELYGDIVSGKLRPLEAQPQLAGRGLTLDQTAILETVRRAQTPAIFDFRKFSDNVVLR